MTTAEIRSIQGSYRGNVMGIKQYGEYCWALRVEYQFVDGTLQPFYFATDIAISKPEPSISDVAATITQERLKERMGVYCRNTGKKVPSLEEFLSQVLN